MLTSRIFTVLLIGDALVPLSLPLAIFFSPSRTNMGWTWWVMEIGLVSIGLTILLSAAYLSIFLIRQRFWVYR